MGDGYVTDPFAFVRLKSHPITLSARPIALVSGRNSKTNNRATFLPKTVRYNTRIFSLKAMAGPFDSTTFAYQLTNACRATNSLRNSPSDPFLKRNYPSISNTPPFLYFLNPTRPIYALRKASGPVEKRIWILWAARHKRCRDGPTLTGGGANFVAPYAPSAQYLA